MFNLMMVLMCRTPTTPRWSPGWKLSNRKRRPRLLLLKLPLVMLTFLLLLVNNNRTREQTPEPQDDDAAVCRLDLPQEQDGKQLKRRSAQRCVLAGCEHLVPQRRQTGPRHVVVSNAGEAAATAATAADCHRRQQTNNQAAPVPRPALQGHSRQTDGKKETR